MRILLITTYYPPDTAVAAVRPYMLAKYLTRRGHEVTVLRSGEFFNSASDFFDMSIPVRVISFLGENSPAERYARGEQTEFPCPTVSSRVSFLPKPFRNLAVALYKPVRFRNWQRGVAEKSKKQLAAIDALKDEHFDVVFSTFADQENLAAGQYAAKLFGCKLIQDFRDPLATRAFYSGAYYRYLKRIQDNAIRHADGVTAVSEGLRQELFDGLNADVPNITLYNGYEPTAQEAEKEAGETDIFTLCYTGILYGELRDFTPLLRALKQLAEQKRIDISKVKLHYAGRDFGLLQQIAETLGMEEILINHGYVSRSEAARLQSISDLFLVLSWNKQDSQGILTGKFYEGIRAGKSILSLISGDLPNSELNILNEKFHYGFCHESCRGEAHFQKLCDYLEKAYNEKIAYGKVCYQPDPELEAAFRYDNLAQQLEEFISKI